MSYKVKIILISWISLVMIGCTSPKKHLIEVDAKTMKEVYQEKFGQYNDVNSFKQRPVNDADTDLSAYTRDANNELKALFPLLPNPTLIMYIYPHLTAGGLEVPGYSTRIKMYRRDHYALPGQVGGQQ